MALTEWIQGFKRTVYIMQSNNIKYSIDRTTDSPLFHMCGVKVERVPHIISGCEKLAQEEYKRIHDNVARTIHWELWAKYEFDVSESGMSIDQKESWEMMISSCFGTCRFNVIML